MKLSIITINYNNVAGLQKTLESVFRQTCRAFEYIVVDGASEDGSKELIEEFSAKADFPFRWLSEPDNGIYAAMNKGIRMAQGEYLHFLNSGDWLADEKVVENMLKTLPDCDIYVGNKIAVRPDGKVQKGKNSGQPVTMLTFYRGTIEHTSAYIRRSLFEKYGYYDESLKIVSDWKWYLEVIGWHNAGVCFTPLYVSCFDTGGISSVNKTLDKAERRKVLETLLPPRILADYDLYGFDIDQMERLKKYPFLYRCVWFVERVLFKLEKWKIKYCSWKKAKNKD